MNHLTLFYFALPARTFNELNGITRNPQMKLNSIHREGDVVLGCLHITPTENEYLSGMINDAYRAKPVYHLKSNSFNFNMSELPFQTYISFLTKTDVENILPTLPELKSFAGFTKHVKEILDHIPTKGVKELLVNTLHIMLGGSFDADKLYNALTSLRTEIEDLSRLYNHMLIISVLVANEIIRSFLDATLIQIELNARIQTLQTLKVE